MSIIRVQLARVEPGASNDPALLRRLGVRDLDRISSLGFAADRDRAVTALAVARLELSRRLGVAPGMVPLLWPEITGGPPAVCGSTLGISWSHSGEWVAFALASGRRVGVDIERIPERTPIDALRKAGIRSLQEFVAREAVGKLVGQGLAVAWPSDATVRPFAAPSGYLGAVAAQGEDWSIDVQPQSQPDPPASASTPVISVWDTVRPSAQPYARR
jgi:phosphopantetheinyl transferase